MQSSTLSSAARSRDRGAVLPLVLVVVLVLAVVVAATATYATTTIRHGQVVESRADRLAAAQAASNDAIEQLELQRPLSLCATLGGLGGGTGYTFPETINDSIVDVSCRLVNGALPSNEGFALVVTGEGMSSGGPTLDLDNGGRPEIKGPVYVHDPSRIDLRQPTTLFEGDLLYQDTAATAALESALDPCDIDPSTSSPLAVDATIFDPPIDDLIFDPSTRGLYCVNRSWNQIFGNPIDDPLFATLAAPAAFVDETNPSDPSETCRVFKPGHYTNIAQLSLERNNYFESGVYHFDNVGLVELSDKQVLTFGNADVVGFPAITNTECDWYRLADASDGAIVYTSGNTRFNLVSNPSGIDVSGRVINDQRIALEVRSTTLDPEVNGLLESDNGNGREAAFHGQFWAPENSLLFLTIPSKKSAILRGGAVVAALRGKVSAAGTDGFLIEVAGSTSSGDLLIDAVADNGRGTTTVRTIADYRTSNGDTAVLARRVIWN